MELSKALSKFYAKQELSQTKNCLTWVKVVQMKCTEHSEKNKNEKKAATKNITTDVIKNKS